ncbi:hypothetical protein [Prescottella equi]|uniref:hypothetical protein n=1 Tax=Rhodococcus hoagii TaxID=43767 RepID=UPI00111BDA10|nr:hypothetical protein [Prescottella equi]
MLSFARAIDAEELLDTTGTADRNLLTDFESYRREQFAAGVIDASRLTKEITELGYCGSAKTVQRFLQSLRVAQQSQPTPLPTPSVRQITV